MASQNKKLKIHFYDVGQGDAVYMRTSKGQDVLIDGGPSSAVLKKIGRDLPFYDRKIELIILSHPEADHLTGLVEVLKRYKVEQIIASEVENDTPVFKEWENLIEEKGIPVNYVLAGSQIVFDENIKMEILHPTSGFLNNKELNNASLVAKLVFGQISFLFTGDIEKPAEKYLSETKGEILNADVLKVAHHGSKTSSSKEFIGLVTPKYAIISAGRNNPYGHPHSSVLETLESFDIEILQTNRDGDIECWSDGKDFGCQAS